MQLEFRAENVYCRNTSRERPISQGGYVSNNFHRQADSAGLSDRIAAISPKLLKYRSS
ncbi:MAG: hypothetical protein MHMPM18_002768 [Marteilia pararefringens]